jgi:hypothetical protein
MSKTRKTRTGGRKVKLLTRPKNQSSCCCGGDKKTEVSAGAQCCAKESPLVAGCHD